MANFLDVAKRERQSRRLGCINSTPCQCQNHVHSLLNSSWRQGQHKKMTAGSTADVCYSFAHWDFKLMAEPIQILPSESPTDVGKRYAGGTDLVFLLFGSLDPAISSQIRSGFERGLIPVSLYSNALIADD